MNDKKISVTKERKEFFTQKELAERWKVSAGTIINWRKEGRFPYFQLPGASKVLYPVAGIIECEKQHTITDKEKKKQQRQPTELKRKKPAVSANLKKEWRI